MSRGLKLRTQLVSLKLTVDEEALLREAAHKRHVGWLVFLREAGVRLAERIVRRGK